MELSCVNVDGHAHHDVLRLVRWNTGIHRVTLGKPEENHRKIHRKMGKPYPNVAIFHSYVRLPEDKADNVSFFWKSYEILAENPVFYCFLLLCFP